MKVTTKLEVVGVKIKFTLNHKVICTKMFEQIPNYGEYDNTNLIWVNIFGDELKSFIDIGEPVYKSLSLSQLGYNKCDIIKY